MTTAVPWSPLPKNSLGNFAVRLHCAQVLLSQRRNDIDQLHLAGSLASRDDNRPFDAHAPQARRLNGLEIHPIPTVRNAG